MNYYIADLHFDHKNILKFDNRPFVDVEEMNSTLIKRWNVKVQDNDDVWILGDFCYHSEKDPSYYLKQLKGRKHLLIGNHDRVILNSNAALQYFDSIEHLQHIKDGKYNMILCHFPIAEWNGKHRGAYHIFGHIHANRDETFEFMKKCGRAFNAGCMINNYEPVTLDELIENNRAFRE